MMKSIFSFQIVSYFLISSLAAQKGASFDLEEKIIYDHALSSSGNTIAVGDDNVVKWFDRDSQELLGVTNLEYNKTITAITLSSDSTLLVTGHFDGMVRVYDIQKNSHKGSYHSHNSQISSLIHDEYSGLLISVSTEGRIIQFDIAEMSIKIETLLENRIITSADFLSAHNSVVFGTSTGEVGVQRLGFSEVQINEVSSSWIRGISCTQDANVLMSINDNGVANFYKLDSTRVVSVGRYDVSRTWLIAGEVIKDGSFLTADLNGELKFHFPQGEYSYRINVPVNDIEYSINSQGIGSFTIATRGKGMILIETSQMRFHERR